MNNILFNINQTTWETTSRWAEELRNHLMKNSDANEDTIQRILYSKTAIDCIFLSDTSGQNIMSFSSSDTMQLINSAKDEFPNIIKQQRSNIARMVYRKKIGYDKRFLLSLKILFHSVLSSFIHISIIME